MLAVSCTSFEGQRACLRLNSSGTWHGEQASEDSGQGWALLRLNIQSSPCLLVLAFAKHFLSEHDALHRCLSSPQDECKGQSASFGNQSRSVSPTFGERGGKPVVKKNADTKINVKFKLGLNLG